MKKTLDKILGALKSKEEIRKTTIYKCEIKTYEEYKRNPYCPFLKSHIFCPDRDLKKTIYGFRCNKEYK